MRDFFTFVVAYTYVVAGWGEGTPREVQPGFKNSLNLKCCESFISLRFSFMVLFLDDFDILVEAEDGARQ